ncbi:hypothetical protein N658DRAFT_500026 [Parathielavia hyrcaniae]|uniref:Uncharacterized protein n=1 Tax=Parathielavia hyrcaniae TaxID=113614 RepID=A0AAN6PYJ6_9PEZI|nr:hypothetical protein N658DRAFT_500026 [Parathielavia hyrcaniae]
MMKFLALTLCIIVWLSQAVSCHEGHAHGVAAITHAPSMRGADWKRQEEQGETCGVVLGSSAARITPVGCGTSATCVISQATNIGTSSTQTALYIECCGLGQVCEALFTACADSSNVEGQTTVNSDVLTCSEPGTSLCKTYSWVENGALGFECGSTGGLIPVSVPVTSITSTDATLTTRRSTRTSERPRTSRTAVPTSRTAAPTTRTAGPTIDTAVPTPSSNAPSDEHDHDHGDGDGAGYSAGMSFGDKIGVGVGCGTVGIIASGIAIFFCRTPRRRAVVSAGHQLKGGVVTEEKGPAVRQTMPACTSTGGG